MIKIFFLKIIYHQITPGNEFLGIDETKEVEEDNVLDNNKVYDEAISCPHKYELINALQLLQPFSLFSNHGEGLVQKHISKQTTTDAFFEV